MITTSALSNQVPPKRVGSWANRSFKRTPPLREMKLLGVLDAWREKRRHRATYHRLACMTPDLLWDIEVTSDDLENLRRAVPTKSPDRVD